MANSVTHGSLPYPIRNARFTLLVPFLDADGDPTDPTTPDTEVSQDGGSFADAAEEVTTVTGSNGLGYVTLTGAETNNSLVGLAFKVASGPKATLMTLYPRNLAVLESGTAGAGAAGTLTLAAGTYTGINLTGCFLRTTGGTGGGGTGGANNQARRVTAYNTSTRVATVTPNWETTPDNTTTYDVLLPEGVLVPMLTALAPTTLARTLDVSAGGEAGVDWANVGTPSSTVSLSGTTVATVTTTTTATNVTTVNGLAANVITAASIAADAITDAKVASDVTIASVTGAVGSVTGNVGGNVTGSVGSVATGGITSASFAAGAITAAAVAADAIGASELAADAVAEIADAVWDEMLSGHLTGGSTGNSLNAAGSAGDPWSTSLPGAYSAGSAGYIIGTNLDAAVSSRGTSTLTQSQVTGGAYALNSASFAFNSAMDFTTAQKAATLARVTLTDTVTTYTGNTPQTGDSFARIGATGSGLTSLAPSATALTSATWTNTRAGYLDNLSAGAVPTLAQILAGGDVDGYTLEQTLKLCLAALAGKLSGAATTTVTIRAADDSKARITATVDADGNRSAITYDAAG